MRKISEKRLQKNIETALYKLLTGKGAPTKEQRDEQRANINAATKFLAIKNKLGDQPWGSGFTNGEVKGEKDDAELDEN